MSLSRASLEAYIATGRPSCTPSSAPDSPSAFRVRCATTCARVQPGSRLGCRHWSSVIASTDRTSRRVPESSSSRSWGSDMGSSCTTGATSGTGDCRRPVRGCRMSKIGGAAACSRPVVLRTFVRTDTTRDRGLAGAGEAHHPGRPGAQPQGHLARPAARLPHRLHGAVRLRQVQPGLRHDLRRGPAALRRVAVGVRPPVPGPDGQARRRLHRGAEPGRLDRPEVHVQEPSLHRRHHHRGLRLPPPPLRARRPPALPGLPQPDRAADARSRSSTG